MKYRLFFIFTVLYFILPMMNILFAYAAVGCMVFPFILLRLNNRKSWCSGICPRANFLSGIRFLSIGIKAPAWLVGKKMRRNLLFYFGLNLLFVTMSTIMVSIGRVDPVDKIRLLIVFQLHFGLPQAFPMETLPGAVVHLAYRFYSIMLTSTLIGIILAVLFKPRTWCTICPINSISSRMLERVN